MTRFANAPRVYPSILQSLLIAGLVILFSIVFAPIVLLGPWIGVEASMFIYYILAFGLSFFIVHSLRRRKQGWSSYDFRLGSARRLTLLVLGTVGLLFGVVSPIQSLMPMSEAFVKTMRSALGEAGPFVFLFMVIAAPILEELIFRGIMLEGLLRRYTPLKSILISSFLFGFVHLNPWQFVTGMVMGCLFGWVYYRCGSVAVCILMHSATNLCSFVMLRLAAGDPHATEPGGILDPSDGGTLGTLAITAAALAVLVGSVYGLRRDFDNHPDVVLVPIPAPEPFLPTSDAQIEVGAAPPVDGYDNHS